MEPEAPQRIFVIQPQDENCEYMYMPYEALRCGSPTNQITVVPCESSQTDARISTSRNEGSSSLSKNNEASGRTNNEALGVTNNEALGVTNEASGRTNNEALGVTNNEALGVTNNEALGVTNNEALGVTNKVKIERSNEATSLSHQGCSSSSETLQDDEMLIKCGHCNKAFLNHDNVMEIVHECEQRSADLATIAQYKCEICLSSFLSTRDLVEHRKSHLDEWPFRCIKCSKLFLKRKSLVEHVQQCQLSDEMSSFKCIYCQKQLLKNESLTEHAELCKRFSNVHALWCIYCQKRFLKKENFLHHIQQCKHSPGEVFSCRGCQEKFVHYSDLLSHAETCIMSRFSRTKQLDTDCKQLDPDSKQLDPDCKVPVIEVHFSSGDSTCINKCSSSQSRNYNMLGLENEVKLESCEDKTVPSHQGHSSSSKTLQNHPEYVASSETLQDMKVLIKCGRCKKAFQNNEHVMEHINSCKKQFAGLASAGVPYKCEFCSSSFELAADLVKHRQTHLDVYPLRCVNCQKKFLKQESLAEHVKQCKTCPDDMWPLRCHYCQKQFLTKQYLDKHVKRCKATANSMWPWKCIYCQKQFLKKENLLGHVTQCKNSPEGTFQCHGCKKQFLEADGLVKHTETCLNTRSYSKSPWCFICAKRFDKEDDCNAHVNDVHFKDGKLRCDTCDELYPSLASFRFHQQTCDRQTMSSDQSKKKSNVIKFY